MSSEKHVVEDDRRVGLAMNNFYELYRFVIAAALPKQRDLSIALREADVFDHADQDAMRKPVVNLTQTAIERHRGTDQHG